MQAMNSWLNYKSNPIIRCTFGFWSNYILFGVSVPVIGRIYMSAVVDHIMYCVGWKCRLCAKSNQTDHLRYLLGFGIQSTFLTCTCSWYTTSVLGPNGILWFNHVYLTMTREFWFRVNDENKKFQMNLDSLFFAQYFRNSLQTNPYSNSRAVGTTTSCWFNFSCGCRLSQL